MNPGDRPAILRIITTYIVFSAVWIFLSDRLLEVILRTPRAISIAQTYKGWFFVLLSAGLIAYLLVREQNFRLRRESLFLTSQRSFTTLLDGSSTPMWIYDLYSRELLVANHAALSSYGFSPTELLRMKIEDVLVAEDGTPPIVPHEEGLSEDQSPKSQSGNDGSVEFQRTELRQLRKKDGTLIQVETITNPIMFAGHSAALVSAVDVTQRGAMQAAAQAAEEQRRRDQEALKENEARLEALRRLSQLTEDSLDQIIDYSLGEAVRLTHSCFGYLTILYPDGSNQSWIKPTVDQPAHPGQVDINHEWGEAFRQGKVVIRDVELETKPSLDTPPLELNSEIRSLSIPVFEGDQIVMLASVGDKSTQYDSADTRLLSLLVQSAWRIIQRKQTEDALFESDARLHAAVESLPFDFWMLDQQGRYVMQNAACLEHWGNLIGCLNSDLDLPAGLLEQWELQDQHALDGKSNGVEISYSKPTGELVYEYSIVAPVMDRGVSLGILGVNVDITDLKQRERELRMVISVANALRPLSTRREIEPVLLDQVVNQIGIDAAALVHFDVGQSEIVFDLGRGDWADITGVHIPAKPVYTQVLQQGLSYQADDFCNTGDLLARPGLKSAIGVPLIAFEQVLAGLWVGSQKTLNEDDLHLLTAVADIAASSIHRGILSEQKEQHLQRLTALRSIDLAITASLDVHLTLNVLLTQIINQLKIDAADVLLYSPETQTLEYAASRGFHTDELRNLHLHLGESHAGRVALGRKVEFISDLAQQPEILAEGISRFGEEFSSYAGVPLTAKGEIKGIIELFSHEHLIPDQEWFEFLQAVSSQAAIAVDNAELFDRLQRSNDDLTAAYDATIEGWSHALELREQEINGHTRHVMEWSLHLARYAGFTDEDLLHLRRGVLLHDIGKMAIPDSILLKPGSLTDAEWEIMKLHPQYAYEMLSPIPYLHPSLDIPYCHHEHWDGSGYPRGLSGEQIPRAARLFTVVDVWDSLSSERPNRAAWEEDEVLEYLKNQSGKWLDPRFVSLFLEHYLEEKQRQQLAG